MATIYSDFIVDAPVDLVWSAVRDVGAVHTRLARGFVLKIAGGVEVVGAPVHAQCLWELVVRVARSTPDVVLRIGLVPYDPPEWRILIVANRRLLWGLLVTPDRDLESPVAHALHRVLSAAHDVRAIRWHESHAVLKQMTTGTPTPAPLRR